MPFWPLCPFFVHKDSHTFRVVYPAFLCFYTLHTKVDNIVRILLSLTFLHK